MVKSRPVKCPICEQMFSRDDEEYITEKNRYYHKSCYLKSDKYLIGAIHDYCLETLKTSYNKQKITRQLRDLIKEGKTYEGVLLTLKYWFEVKNGAPEKANGGIGIVSYVYIEAKEYYERQERLKSAAENINIPKQDMETKEHYVVFGKPITKPKRVKLFDMGG